MTHYKANKHRGRHIIRMYSPKNQCAVKLESALEAAFARGLELDPNVKSYASQPETMSCDGQSYTPDFLVVYHSGRGKYIEVHQSSRVDAEYAQKLKKFSAYSVKTTGRPIELVTERYINLGCTRAYEQMLFIAADVIPDDLLLCDLPHSLTLGELVSCLAERDNAPLSLAYKLIIDAWYDTDLRNCLSSETILTANQKVRGGDSCSA